MAPYQFVSAFNFMIQYFEKKMVNNQMFEPL